MLVGVAGLPASGKTTVTKELEKKGFIRISRDDFITFLFKPTNYNSREQKDVAFEVMLLVSCYYLRLGKKVVLDCPSFSQEWAVIKAQKTAKKTKSKFKLIYLKCSDAIAVRRIKSSKKHIAWDRTPKLYFEVKRRFQPIKIKHKKIETDQPIIEIIKEVSKYIK